MTTVGSYYIYFIHQHYINNRRTALDTSYIIPIACRRIFAKHPEVMFKPGPFYMGDGILGLYALLKKYSQYADLSPVRQT